MKEEIGRSERKRLGEPVGTRLDEEDMKVLDETAQRFGMGRSEYVRTVVRQSLKMPPEMRFLAEEIAASRLLPVEVRAAEDAARDAAAAGRDEEDEDGSEILHAVAIDIQDVVNRVESAKAGMADRMFTRFQARLVKGE